LIGAGLSVLELLLEAQAAHEQAKAATDEQARAAAIARMDALFEQAQARHAQLLALSQKAG
jgi:hypothetical protein